MITQSYKDYEDYIQFDTKKEENTKFTEIQRLVF